MNWLNNLNIKSKLVVVLNIVFICLMIGTGSVIISKEKKQILNELRTNIQSGNKAITDLIDFSRDMISTYLYKDLQGFVEHSQGEFYLSTENGIPELMFNDQVVANNKKVLKAIRKRIHKTHGFVSVYEYNSGKFTCINSTNTQRIGKTIHQNDSIFTLINAGKKATINTEVNGKYFTSIPLLLEHNNETLGLIEIGRNSLADWKINKIISERKLYETGFSAFVKNNGDALYISEHHKKESFKDEEFFIRSSKESYNAGNFDVVYNDTLSSVFYTKVPFFDATFYSVVKVEEYLKPVKRTRNFIIIAIIIGSIVFILFSLLLARNIISGVDSIIQIIKKMSLGDISVNTNVNRKDEVGLIANSIEKLVEGLKQKVEFAKEIGEGKFNTDFKALSENDTLGDSLIEMRQNLIDAKLKEEENKKEDEKRNWASTELANFGQLLRANEESIEDLSYTIMSKLVTALGANQGALFISNDAENEDELVYELKGAVAYDRRRLLDSKFEYGIGLIGRCAHEKKTIYMTDLPDEYANITSGLGTANPNVMLIVPLVSEETVVGVIELASFKQIEKFHIDFIEKLGEIVASAIISAKVTDKTSKLLQDSNKQREEMAAQEEELRQNLEEMEATQEDLKRQMEHNKEIEGKLMQQTTLLDSLMGTLPDFVFFKDLTSKFIKVSDSMLNVFKAKSTDEIVGKTDFDFHTKENAQMYFNEEQEIIKRKKGFVDRIQTEIKNDGSELKISLTKLPLFDEEGNVIGTFGISKELTSKKSK